MWKLAEVPANYNDEDELDIDGMMNLVDDLHSEWWAEDPQTQRQAIANAFRAALTSPRQNLKWNSIVYQDLMHLPPEIDTPEEFEQVIRQRKEKWDRFGQQTLDMINANSQDEELINYGPGMVERYQPGIWKNIRNAAVVGPYIEDLRRAAIEDVKQGGDGRVFRRELMDLNIPGIGPKIAAFVWLLLAPKTSKLATIDVHMMRALGKDQESPKDLAQYLEFERELDAQREAAGYEDVPLGVYQWAVWDKTRTPGWHQDHTALRPLNPVDWRNVDWAPQERVRTKDNHIPPGQLSLDDPQPAVPAADANQGQDFITPPTAPTQTFASWSLKDVWGTK
jgi:hypothetical protein